MAVAFDAYTRITPVADPSTTHIPAADPAAVLFLVTHVTAEPVTATYGGSSLTEIATVANSVGGELAGQSLTALLRSGVSSGVQTAAVDSGASGAGVNVFSLTASTTVTFVNAVSMEATAVADPSTTLSLSGRVSFVAEVWASGQNSTTGVGPLTGWTLRFEQDDGTFTDGCYSYDTVDSADVTVGSTQGSEDWMMLAVAVGEAVSGAVSRPPARRTFFGVGR